MIVSYRTLARFFPVALPEPRELYERLGLAGLEPEGFVALRERVAELRVGRIVAVDPLDERLRRVELDLGEHSVTVVAGDPTLHVDERVVYAPPGAQLGEVEVAERRFGEVRSEGLLVSRLEAGVGGEGDRVWRIDAPPGTAVAEHVDDDHLLEFGITPNRGDLFGHLGIAREVATLWALPAPTPPDLAPWPTEAAAGELRIEDPDCPIYVGLWFSLAEVGPPPDEVEGLLGRAGMRCIHPLVDLTNYVMLELGQPMHVFDADRIEGIVRVRAATAGERFTALDGRELRLRGGELVVADDAGVLALAGVIGGTRAEVTSATRRVLLESAHFAPGRVARGRRPLGISTEASIRFERGVDPRAVHLAVRRFLSLLTATTEEVRLEALATPGDPPTERSVPWDPAAAKRLLGALPAPAEQERIMVALGFTPLAGPSRRRVPSWRFDVATTEDLAEEIARIWGYDRFAATLPAADLRTPVLHTPARWRARILDWLVDRGFRQGIHLSFSADAAPDAVPLANPLGEQTRALRRRLVPGLAAAAERNHRRQRLDLRLVEVGKVFRGVDGRVEERWHLGLLWSGTADPEAWSGRRPVDLYDLKGIVEGLLMALSVPVEALRWSAVELPGLHPTRTAHLQLEDEELGFVGELLDEAWELSAPTVVAELDLDRLAEWVADRPAPTFVEPPRYPAAERDLAFWWPLERPVAELVAALRDAAGPHLVALRIFDHYAGKGVPEGMRSVAVRLRFRRPDGTLAAEEVEAAIAAAVAAAEALGARLRG